MNANELKVGHRILYRECWSRSVEEGVIEEITQKGNVKIGGQWLTEDEVPYLILVEDLGPSTKEEK